MSSGARGVGEAIRSDSGGPARMNLGLGAHDGKSARRVVEMEEHRPTMGRTASGKGRSYGETYVSTTLCCVSDGQIAQNSLSRWSSTEEQGIH